MFRPAFVPFAAVFVCLFSGLPAAAQVPPDEAWRAVETEHFRVTFPAHLEDLGRRAGALAERAYRELTEAFREGPTARIDIVLTDHVDVSNGFARFWPSNRIVLFARPPADHLALAYASTRARGLHPMRAASPGAGRGATFTSFVLPVTGEAGVSTPAPADGPGNPASRRAF